MYKGLLSVVLLVLLSSGFAQALPADFQYDFPGCNGGGGAWMPAQILIPQTTCSAADQSAEVEFRGHCNGRLLLAVTCDAAEVKSVDIKDCFCD